MKNTITSLFAGHEAVVFFDTETTGLDPRSDRIIELAAIRAEPDGDELRETARMDAYIKLPDGGTIPQRITELTHITDAMLSAEGVTQDEAAKQFIAMLQGEHIVMAAHNAHFDLGFTRPLLRGAHFGHLEFLDTLTVYKDRRKYPHKLASAIEAYGITGEQNSHRAIDDVSALLAVTLAMGAERDDLADYLNIFGYNRKYRPPTDCVRGVTYAPQSFRDTMAPPEYTFPALLRRGGGQ
jgi:DNA polymerase-3 subunit epsilon